MLHGTRNTQHLPDEVCQEHSAGYCQGMQGCKGLENTPAANGVPDALCMDLRRRSTYLPSAAMAGADSGLYQKSLQQQQDRYEPVTQARASAGSQCHQTGSDAVMLVRRQPALHHRTFKEDTQSTPLAQLEQPGRACSRAREMKTALARQNDCETRKKATKAGQVHFWIWRT